MPKRKRGASAGSSTVVVAAAATTGTTYSLMDGKVDVLEGLVMHREVISGEFEEELISFVEMQCERGRKGELKKPTYLRASGARSQGNQRESIMYGGFFDFNLARPGKRGLVPPFPPIIERLVDHLVSKNYLPSDVRPDSCIINKYGQGDCIPPHVDHLSYYRPISTLSLLGEEPMLVGSRFRTVRSCTWAPTCGLSIPLMRRSLLVLGGNSGNVAKHCISACQGPRISITLRKQPPPEWKPDESELKSDRRGKTNAINADQSNKTPSSKAAKRKRKKLKGQGLVDIVDRSSNGTTIESNNNSNRSEKACITQRTKHDPGLTDSAKKKSSEKQARRNARRIEKKTMESLQSTGEN